MKFDITSKPDGFKSCGLFTTFSTATSASLFSHSPILPHHFPITLQITVKKIYRK